MPSSSPWWWVGAYVGPSWTNFNVAERGSSLQHQERQVIHRFGHWMRWAAVATTTTTTPRAWVVPCSGSGSFTRCRTYVVRDRHAHAGFEFGRRLVHKYPTAVRRQQDRQEVMGLASGEGEAIDPQQGRADRGVEQSRGAGAGDLRGDLVLHAVDHHAGI